MSNVVPFPGSQGAPVDVAIDAAPFAQGTPAVAVPQQRLKRALLWIVGTFFEFVQFSALVVASAMLAFSPFYFFWRLFVGIFLGYNAEWWTRNAYALGLMVGTYLVALLATVVAQSFKGFRGDAWSLCQE